MEGNGKRIPDAPIAVDFFKRSWLPARMLYFLTHAHADHLQGLDSSFDQKIYCTALTKTLLLQLISINPELIIEVPYDEPFQVRLPCSEPIFMCVTAINAHHCPGSAMFIFEGYFGKVLYTGDFRLSSEHMNHELLQSCEPDLLFIDNTYNKSTCTFPTRDAALERIVDLVDSCPDRTFLALNRIGKEEILEAITKRTSLTIGVSEEQYKKLCSLSLKKICSLETDSCKVTVVPFHSVKASNVERWTSEMPTQVIVPTCRYVGRECTLPKHPSVTVVHHSDHCDYNELLQFVKLVKPVAIQPIVSIKDCINMNRFNPFLSTKPPIKYEIPRSIFISSYVSSANRRFLGKHKSILYTSPVSRLIASRRSSNGIQYLSPNKAPPSAVESSDDNDMKRDTTQEQVPTPFNKNHIPIVQSSPPMDESSTTDIESKQVCVNKFYTTKKKSPDTDYREVTPTDMPTNTLTTTTPPHQLPSPSSTIYYTPPVNTQTNTTNTIPTRLQSSPSSSIFNSPVNTHTTITNTIPPVSLSSSMFSSPVNNTQTNTTNTTPPHYLPSPSSTIYYTPPVNTHTTTTTTVIAMADSSTPDDIQYSMSDSSPYHNTCSPTVSTTSSSPHIHEETDDSDSGLLSSSIHDSMCNDGVEDDRFWYPEGSNVVTLRSLDDSGFTDYEQKLLKCLTLVNERIVLHMKDVREGRFPVSLK